MLTRLQPILLPAQAMATYQACQVIGMPECRINLAHLVSYLSEAPKSTRAYEGYSRAEEAAKLDPSIPVPLPLRNAPTRLMKDLGYARGYKYNPAYACAVLRSCSFRGSETLIASLGIPSQTIICQYNFVVMSFCAKTETCPVRRGMRMLCASGRWKKTVDDLGWGGRLKGGEGRLA